MGAERQGWRTRAKRSRPPHLLAVLVCGIVLVGCGDAAKEPAPLSEGGKRAQTLRARLAQLEAKYRKLPEKRELLAKRIEIGKNLNLCKIKMTRIIMGLGSISAGNYRDIMKDLDAAARQIKAYPQ